MKRILIILTLMVFLGGCLKLPSCSDEYYKGIETSNASLCELAKDNRPFYCREQCIWQVANATGNVELCEQIDLNLTIMPKSTILLRDFCYGQLAFRLNDTSICNMINKESTKNGCFYAMNITRN